LPIYRRKGEALDALLDKKKKKVGDTALHLVVCTGGKGEGRGG